MSHYNVWDPIDKAITNSRISRLERYYEQQQQHVLERQNLEKARKLLFQCQQAIKTANQHLEEPQNPTQSYQIAFTASLDLVRQGISSRSFSSLEDKEYFIKLEDGLTDTMKRSATVLGTQQTLHVHINKLRSTINAFIEEQKMWKQIVRLLKLCFCIRFIMGIALAIGIFLTVGLLGTLGSDSSSSTFRKLLIALFVFSWAAVIASAIFEKRLIRHIQQTACQYGRIVEKGTVLTMYLYCKNQVKSDTRWIAQLENEISQINAQANSKTP